MKALQFLKSLLPNFQKSTVLEDIRLTKLVLVTVTQPAYAEAMRLFGNRKLSNAELKNDWDIYRRQVKGATGPNTVYAIDKSFKPMIGTLDLIETLVEKDYNDDIEGVGVTYYKAAVLQMQESISFAADYALKYLNYILVVETAELFDDNGLHRDADGQITVIDEINANITPAELRWLKERFQDFCTVMNTLSRPTPAIKADFEKIPDINITEQGDRHVQSTIGASKVDPFMHSLIPVAMNPIYHVRIKWANWQHNRHEQAKAEKEVLELRLLRMERQLQGKKDPALEREIEYVQKRIDDLRDRIRKEEEAYA